MGTTRRLSFLLRSGRHRPGFFTPRAFAWSALVALAGVGLGAGCGRSEVWEDPGPFPAAPPACGDGVCDGIEDCGSCGVDCGVCAACGDGACDPAGESCGSCPLDCGLCPGCGDGACSGAESCSTCPADCGVCAACGDGACVAPEDCLSCAPDCGDCASCGDGVCDAALEGCFSCAADCGACDACGDGACSGTETCASCQRDCGVCSVCPNGVCESFETCSICPADCGACEPAGCLEVTTCAFQCVDLEQSPPTVSLACVSNCVAQGCADVQFFVNQVLTCALASLPVCNSDFGCVQEQCATEIAACIGATC
ncbi:hypothetical protein WME91_29500 [Sorangium sp. So ce269]